MSRTVTPKTAKFMQQGMQLMQANAFVEAGRAFERAAQQTPHLADAHAMRADALMRAGKLDIALSSVDRALRLSPGWGEALMLRGNILALLERFAEAEASIRDAVRSLGATPALQANLGNVLLEQKRFDEALAAFDAAVVAGETLELLVCRARALDGLRQLDACEQAWQRVLERAPDSLEALERLANIGLTSGRYQLLEQVCRKGIVLAPTAPSFFLGLAVSLMWLGKEEEETFLRFSEAADLAREGDRDVYEQALVGKATSLFHRRRLREGWETYFAHYPRDRMARERYPRLALEPKEISALRGTTVCINPVQGIGDQLFFLRFAASLRAMGNRLLLKTHPKLYPLLSRRSDLFDWIGREEDTCPDYEVGLLASDLALAAPDAVAPPLAMPIDAGRRSGVQQRLNGFGPPPYIGVTWRAGLTPAEQDAWGGRSWLKLLPPYELGRALRGISGTVVIVQRLPRPDELADFKHGLGRDALDASWMNDDLLQAVALLSLLAEYVGVSNTNMHILAGLPDSSARVLATHPPPEWRWGLQGSSSPWFPTFKLYRQRADRTWVEPLSLLNRDLTERLGLRSR